MTLSADDSAQVARRRVFYIHGFDPRGPSPYHRMFVEEAARQAIVDHAAIDIGPRRTADAMLSEWQVAATFDGVTTHTRYSFLRWDDVVRTLWTRGDARLFREMLRWLGELSANGFIARARREAWPGFLATITPPLALAAFALALLLSIAIAALAGGNIAGLAGLPPWTGLILGLVPLAVAGPAWRRIDNALNLAWLGRCFTFICDASQRRYPALEARAQAFAERIVAAAADGQQDEVLVVGHSQGACVAVMAMARALALDPRLGSGANRVSLLTLGQPITVWTQLSGAGWFRDELETLARATAVTWLDVTSPSDGASACGLGPLHGLAADLADRPMRRSPRFHVILSPEAFHHIRRRPFEYHFQYLKAAEAARAYDYFRLTCGPEPLAEFGRAWTAHLLDGP